MIYLYNIFPYFLVIFMGLIIYFAVPSKVGKVFMGVLTLVMLLVYTQIQPSYLPKGTVQRQELPAFERSEKPMVDRYLHTTPGSEHDKWIQEQDKAVRRRLKEAE